MKFWKQGNVNKRKRKLLGLNQGPNVHRSFITSRIFLVFYKTLALGTEAMQKKGKKGESKRRMVNICGSHRKVNTIYV